MKKQIDKDKAKSISHHRYVHNLKRKSKRYNPKKQSDFNPINILERLVPVKRTIIPMPNIFSLTENINGTMSFFKDLMITAEKHEPIFIDADGVSTITPDAILYLILIIEKIHEFKIYSIRGNSPSHPTCKKIFQQSGFLNYVKSPLNKYATDTDIFTIREGTKTQPTTAKEVLMYVKKHLEIEKSNKNTKAIFSLIIEAMANTYNHASAKGEDRKKWYLMAYYTDDGDVEFAMLDNGETIPKTIRKDFTEKIAQLFKTKKTTDHELIMSAFQGKFRTKTKEKKRGKGLPKMYELAKDNYIKDLVIISNQGYVNAMDDKKHKLEDKFHGTLISWKATKRIGE